MALGKENNVEMSAQTLLSFPIAGTVGIFSMESEVVAKSKGETGNERRWGAAHNSWLKANALHSFAVVIDVWFFK